MTLADEFMIIFGVWEVARPYIHMIVDEREMALVVRMQGRSMTVDEVAHLLEVTCEQAADFLQRCYSRYIVNKSVEGGVTRYVAADFAARLNHFAMYENWDDIPAHARKVIDRRFLDEFISQHQSNVRRKMQGLASDSMLPNDAVLLLDEVEEMIEAATDIIVQPCDCRRLGQNCDRPVEVCIWLDEGARAALDRGHGQRLTKEEARDLVRWADRKGLMHTADSEWHERGLHAICNCCACDCYPFRAAQALNSKGAWPRSRYVAVYDPERCNFCGTCVRRCHFAAFYHDDSLVDVGGKMRKSVRFDPDACWGCGLCANTCPEGAITMGQLGG